jgi:hypothetical protein
MRFKIPIVAQHHPSTMYIETLHNTQALHTTFYSHYAPQKTSHSFKICTTKFCDHHAPTKKHIHISKLWIPPSFITTSLKHYAFLKFLTFALMIQYGVTPHSMEEAMPWIVFLSKNVEHCLQIPWQAISCVDIQINCPFS